MKPVVNLTAAAWEVIWREGVATEYPWYLRVGVKGGGCSGYEYVLETVPRKREDPWPPNGRDIYWTQYDPVDPENITGCGIGICVDPISAQYLRGTTIDFVKSGLIEGFKFTNPNATRSCGCGKSFST